MNFKELLLQKKWQFAMVLAINLVDGLVFRFAMSMFLHPVVIVISAIPIILTGWLFGWWAVLVSFFTQFYIGSIVMKTFLPESLTLQGTIRGLFNYSMYSGIGLLASLLGKMSRENKKLNIQLLKKNQELKDLTLRDPLTHLNNRRYVYEVIYAAAQTFLQQKITPEVKLRDVNIAEKVMGVFLLDIDNFKQVNDVYGHDVGDDALVVVANQIKEQVRFDDTVTRWGGEEFLVILPYTKSESLAQISLKILTAVSQAPLVLPDGKKITLTVSIGGICYPFYNDVPERISFEEIIKLSDSAMYKSKEGGRNRSTMLYAGNEMLTYQDMKNLLSLPQSQIPPSQLIIVTTKGPATKNW